MGLAFLTARRENMARFHSPHRNLTIDATPKVPKIRFVNGRFDTEDKDQIELLRKHEGYGRFIFELEQPKQAQEAPQTGPLQPSETDPEGDGVHVCPECGREFDTPQGLRAHFRQKHPDSDLL